MKVYYPKFSPEELVRRVRKGVKAILKSLPLKTVVLFGSYAEGRHTAASDVDLLIVYEDPRRRDDYSVCWDALKIPQLELLVYTRSEYERLGESVREIERKGIIVWRG
ncbi:MAG: nucleotidyltransferase domain-containing protein [Candidatus Bathyarchaeia archaeon]